MKKFILSFALLIFVVSSVPIYGRVYRDEEITEDDKIQLAMLMNQVQYAISNIMQNKNKEILTQEFDFVINQVDKTKLWEGSVRRTYSSLLENITKLKLTENERAFIIERNERERKQAYTKALTSFGSVFSPGFSPVSLATSLVYAGISAGLNIANAKNEADNKLKEELFKLSQKDLEDIDNLRRKLFDSCADIITNYGIPGSYEIIEKEMKDFVKNIGEKKKTKDLIKILKDKTTKFQNFPIFWYQLGSQYQLDGNDNEAIKCYDKFENLKEKYSYITKDPYYIAVAKNRIQILEKNISVNLKEIYKYLKIIENNLTPDNESENRLFLASIYFKLGNNEKAKNLLEINIAREEFYYSSCQMLALIEMEETKSSKILNPAILLELSNTNFVLDTTKDKNFIVSIPKKFALGKVPYILFNDKIYTDTYEINNSSNNFCKTEIEVDLVEKDKFEVTIGLLDKNNQIIELTFDCSYMKKNKKVSNLLKEVDINIANNDIEACLLPEIYKKLDNFSYDPEEDKEYTILVDKRKKMGIENKEQKEAFMKEEENKLEELKTNNKGKKIAINEEITNINKTLYSKPYYCSKVFVDNAGNIFCYSLKQVRFSLDLYKFEKFGNGIKEKIKEENILDSKIKYLVNSANKGDNSAQYSLFKKYSTGNGVEKNVIKAYKYLIVSAINGNTDAQFELANVYANISSALTQDFIKNSIVIPNSGLLERGNNYMNPLKDKSTIEKEQIAFYWYKKTADAGNGQAIFEIAKRYEKGLGVKKNKEEATKYYKEASKHGISEANEKINK